MGGGVGGRLGGRAVRVQEEWNVCILCDSERDLGLLGLGFLVPESQLLFELLDPGEGELEFVHLSSAVTLHSILHSIDGYCGL